HPEDAALAALHGSGPVDMADAELVPAGIAADVRSAAGSGATRQVHLAPTTGSVEAVRDLQRCARVDQVGVGDVVGLRQRVHRGVEALGEVGEGVTPSDAVGHDQVLWGVLTDTGMLADRSRKLRISG